MKQAKNIKARTSHVHEGAHYRGPEHASRTSRKGPKKVKHGKATAAYTSKRKALMKVSKDFTAAAAPVNDTKAKAGKTKEEKGRVSPSTKKKLIIAALCLLAVWIAGFGLFDALLMPNTTINGIDCSFETKEQSMEKLNRSAAVYKLHVTSDDSESDLTASDVNLRMDSQQVVNDAINQTNPWLWPIEVWKTHDIVVTPKVTYSKTALKSFVDTFIMDTQKNPGEPKNATIGYSPSAKRFVVIPEVPGNAYDKKLVLANMEQAVSRLEPVITLGKESKTKPSVTHDDPRLKTACQKADAMTKRDIDLMVGGSQVMNVSQNDIHRWVVLSDKLKPEFDEEKIASWVSDKVAPKINTVGSERTFTDANGNTATVKGGTYGWKVDSKKLAEDLSQALVDTKQTKIQIPMKQKAAKWNGQGKADWGDTYVEVDLSDQSLHFYKSGEVALECSVVTGNTAKNHGTPTGVYKLNNKSKNIKLIGMPDPKTGKPEYETPVQRWMPFVDNAIGLHDANWRSSFGGTIYRYNGSHGCVNMPPSKALKLFDMISIGTPVIVHE